MLQATVAIVDGNRSISLTNPAMKKSLPLLLAGLTLLFTQSCAVPPGPSIAALGPGSDAAYLNATRGRADAQITADQAKQYSRQRQQVSEEMMLEQQKRQGTINNVRGVLGIGGDLLRIGSYLR